jgi:hypothetical protein
LNRRGLRRGAAHHKRGATHSAAKFAAFRRNMAQIAQFGVAKAGKGATLPALWLLKLNDLRSYRDPKLNVDTA